MTIKDVKNLFGKEKYISEFICYQLKITTHQGGKVWHVVWYTKLIFVGRVYVLSGTLAVIASQHSTLPEILRRIL